jgi:hypothetical protein
VFSLGLCCQLPLNDGYQKAVSKQPDSRHRNAAGLCATGTGASAESRTSGADPDKEARVFEGLGTQRLLALFVAGWLLFSFPLLGLWDRDAALLGIPLFPAALFILWGLLIAIIAWWMERPGQTPLDD